MGPTFTPTPTPTPPYFTATWGNTCEEAQAKCSGSPIPVYDFTRYISTGTTMCDMEWIVNNDLFNSGLITGSTFYTVQCGTVPQVLRQWHLYLPPGGGSFSAYQYGACSLCATPTPTPTPITPTFTPTPTPHSPTFTPTPTPTLFNDIVGYGSNDATVCTSPISSFSMTGNASTFCTSTIFTSSGWFSIASGTYYLSYGGNIQTVSHIVGTNTATVTGGGCSTCPTPTPTPTSIGPTITPTPTPSYDFYLADRYECLVPSGCSYVESNVPVAFPSGYSYIGSHYYQPIGPDGYVYKITSSSTYAVSIILSTTFHSSNCSTACSLS
jgi:hypothetical protein